MKKSLFKYEIELIKPYVPGKPVEELQLELGLKEIEKLASNENPLGPSPKAIEAIIREVTNINIYPDADGTNLKRSLAEKYKLSPRNIVLGNGGEELLKTISETFVNPGDEAIMAKTTFGKYASEVLLMGGIAVQIPLKDYKHDIAEFVNNITDKTKLIYVCNPNNPTGNIMAQGEVEYLIKKVPEDVVIVFDEAYYDYAVKNPDFPKTLDILKQRENTIILRTFSKVSGIAAVRVGYLLTSEKIAEAMGKVKLTFSVNRLAQAAAIGALQDEEHTEKTIDLNYKSLAIMERYFEENNFEYIKSYANFIFVNVNKDSKMVFQKLLERGIIVRAGFLWGWDNWLRVSTGTIEQTEKLINQLNEVLGED